MSDWCPFAIRRDGPAWKVGPPQPKVGQVNHSAEGYWAGAHSVLDNDPVACWQFTVGYDRIEQHYGLETVCIHAGNFQAHLTMVGIEHLGMANEALTPYQVDATIWLTRWCAEQQGYTEFTRERGQPGWWIAEHREIGSTACPSERFTPKWAHIMEELMADEQLRAFVAEALRKLDAADKGIQALLREALPNLDSRIKSNTADIANLAQLLRDLEGRGP